MRNCRGTVLLVTSLCLFSFSPILTTAQSHVVDGLYWTRVQTTFKWGPKWSGSFELEERRFFGPDRAHQRVLPDFRFFYHFHPNLKTGLGYTNFSIRSPQTANLPIEQVLSEQRYAVFLAGKWNLDKGAFKAQWKTELRNFDRDPLDGELNYLDYLIRLRFLAEYSHPLKGNWKAKFGDELHLQPYGNIEQQFFDQNRIYTGISYKSGNYNYGLDYLFWYQKNRKGSVFYHRHILRFTIQYAFSFR